MSPARTQRPRPGFLGLAIVMLVVGCAAPGASAAPTAAGPPAVPDGWQLVASDSGDVRLALPPDIPVMFTEVGIMAWLPLIDGALQLEIHATGPAAIAQPGRGEDLGSWLEQSGWVPRAGDPGYVVVAPATVTEVDLAAGRALEVDVTADPGLPNEVRVVVWAIETVDGIAIIQIVGNPKVMDERAGELRLVAMLAEFGDLDDPS